MKQKIVKKRESALSNTSIDNYISPKPLLTTSSSINNANSQDSIRHILNNSQNTSAIKEHVDLHISKGTSSTIRENIPHLDTKYDFDKRAPKDTSNDKKPFTYLKVREMKKLFNRNMSIRDALILNVLYETGCTVKEATMIKLSDIDGVEGVIYINKNQGIKERVSYVSGNLILKVKKFYKKEFGIFNIESKENNSRYLFSTRQSKKITTRRIRQIVKDNCKKIGVLNASPKLLRYTHIVHAYEKGMPINLIQKQVGIKKSRAIEVFCNLKEIDNNREYRLM